ncbi:MAG: glycoside-pentoside-hexuronide (GPH):cation symporter [Eubacteriales bacterium]|nr:glycoside-pentoside-hexuronide (GPH):cation symporter [Eubacteriales bacterium]
MEKSKKIPKSLLFLWPSRAISYGVASILLGYVSYYATDFMGISMFAAGIIFMLSKIFDGFTDIVAGYIIDKTNSKLGKGRPYELALIGYWLFIVILFSAPEMGVKTSYVYLFVTYTMINSVFLTFLNCNEPVYLSNAIDDSSQSVTILSITGFVSMIATMAASMILPQYVQTIGATKEGWRIMAIAMAIPFTLLGLLRFATVKEKKRNAVAVTEKITLKQMVKTLLSNKYILLFSIIILISNLGSNLVGTVTTYYFRYIIGDLSKASIMGLSMLAIIIVIVLTPVLSQKFGFVNVIRTTTLIGMIGYFAKILFPTNVMFLFIANIFSMLGFYTMFSFAGTFVIDCIDYGEWKEGIRSEGIISCSQSVTAKIGTAIGAGVVGVVVGMAGYDGAAAVQNIATKNTIIAMYSIVPGIFCLIQFILLRVYDLDKKLPEIREDLAKRRA